MNRISGFPVLIVVVALAITLGWFIGKSTPKHKVVSVVNHTDTVWIKDTTYIEKERIRTVLNKVVDTVFLYTVDSILVEVPRELSVVDVDTLARVWLKGNSVEIDSVKVFSYYPVVETVYTTLPVNSSKWGLGISAGVAVTPLGVTPYIGAGVTYNLINFGKSGKYRGI